MAKAPIGRETKAHLLERTEREKVKFMRLQFTDILGTIKNVEIPNRQFEEALDGKIMFDGSSIEGFVRIEESDMYLEARFFNVPRIPLGRTDGRERRTDDLRYLRARRDTVCRMPAHRAQESDRARGGAAAIR